MAVFFPGTNIGSKDFLSQSWFILLGHYREHVPGSDLYPQQSCFSVLSWPCSQKSTSGQQASSVAYLHTVFGEAVYDVAPYSDTFQTEISTMRTFPLKRKPDGPYRRDNLGKRIKMHWPGMIRRPLRYWNQQGGNESDRQPRSIQTNFHISFHK